MSVVCDVSRLHIVVSEQILNISILTFLPRKMSCSERPKHLCKSPSRLGIALHIYLLVRYSLFVLPAVIYVDRLILPPLQQRFGKFNLIRDPSLCSRHYSLNNETAFKKTYQNAFFGPSAKT
jgi:hypothetical protein